MLLHQQPGLFLLSFAFLLLLRLSRCSPASLTWLLFSRAAADTGTLSTDWESVGSGEGADWSAFWAVRGLGSTKQSLLDIIRDGFLSGARLLRRRK